jgi:hypothetical protein
MRSEWGSVLAAALLVSEPIREPRYSGPPKPRKPSGKNRDKIKAARKQKRKAQP